MRIAGYKALDSVNILHCIKKFQQPSYLPSEKTEIKTLKLGLILIHILRKYTIAEDKSFVVDINLAQ